MIDDIDLSASTLRLLASQSLKHLNNRALLKLLSDEDYVVRTLVARELQVRGGEYIFENVIDLVDSGSAVEREMCAFVLGQLGTPGMPFKDSSLPYLENLLTDSNSEVRAAAAAAIGHICFNGMTERVENALRDAAEDECDDVRCCVAVSLGRASNKSNAKATLLKLMQDRNRQVREYAELGLSILESE